MYHKEGFSHQLEMLSNMCSEICKDKGWKTDWEGGGCYLHLEASEFIESLRGKKGTPESTLQIMEEFEKNLDEMKNV